MRWLVLAVAATIFQALPLAAAVVNVSTADIPESRVRTESYFRERAASNLLYAHISFMLLSWAGALPICSLHFIRTYLSLDSDVCNKA